MDASREAEEEMCVAPSHVLRLGLNKGKREEQLNFSWGDLLLSLCFLIVVGFVCLFACLFVLTPCCCDKTS